jgi:hypothetical protein
MHSRKAECMVSVCNIFPHSFYNISFIKHVYTVCSGIMSILFAEVIPSQKYRMNMRSVYSVTELWMFEIQDAVSNHN